MNMIRGVEPVVGNVFEYGWNFGTAHNPAQSAPIFRESNRNLVRTSKTSCKLPKRGIWRVAAVEYRVGLDAGVDAIVLEVPDENVPYVLKTTGVGPFEAGIFADTNSRAAIRGLWPEIRPRRSSSLMSKNPLRYK